VVFRQLHHDQEAAGSAAGEIGILTAGGVHAPATIVALAVFGALGIGALIVATIAIRRR
jgi:hypothetical protein